MNAEHRALDTVEHIYEAIHEPEAWRAVVEAMSDAYGGAAVVLLLRPHGDHPARSFEIGLKPELSGVLADHDARGLPWETGPRDRFAHRFGRANELFPDELVAGTDFYRLWMQPQGLAPVGPILHTIADENGQRVAVLAAYQRVGGRPFDDDDLAFGDLLAPHFARAFALSRILGGVQRQRAALGEVMDRLPTGVIVLDAKRRPIVASRAASRIVEQHDGLELDSEGPRAANERDDLLLQQLVTTALECSRTGRTGPGVVSLSRPSGRRPFAAYVAPLQDIPGEMLMAEAAAVILVTDPDAGQVTTLEILQQLYHLTRAEAELVQFLARGYSLDEVASLRGVTVNTARSQLKQVFAKTDTRRQGELVRLVLTGISSINE